MRHCCVVPGVVCHWHRYVILMASFFFWVMVFPLLLEWIVLPKVGFGEVFGLCTMFLGVCCVGPYGMGLVMGQRMMIWLVVVHS